MSTDYNLFGDLYAREYCYFCECYEFVNHVCYELPEENGDKLSIKVEP